MQIDETERCPLKQNTAGTGLSNSQKTNITEPKNFDQSGTFFGGGMIFTQRFYNHTVTFFIFLYTKLTYEFIIQYLIFPRIIKIKK